MPKLLFAPLPNSWGHVGRTLALIDKLPKRYEKCILLDKTKAALIKKLGYRVILVPEFKENNLARDFFKLTRSYLNVFSKLSPQKIIVDNNPYALLAAFISKKPVLEIHTPLSLAGQFLIKPDILPPAWQKLWLQLKKHYPYSFIRKFLKRKNKIIIPSIPAWEEQHLPNSSFIGPLFWQGWQTLPTLQPYLLKKNILITFGSELLPNKILKELKKYAHHNDLRLLFSSKLANLEKAIKRSEVVICHGGHTTVLKALSYGKPLLCLPQNKDQEIVSRQVQKKKCGLSSKDLHTIKSSLDFILNNSKFKKNSMYIKNKIYSFRTKTIRI
ncbi:glycosyltransferase [Candidatus Margulisiibacteriota bacterium]